MARGRYFLELMDHGIEIERRVRDGLLEIGKKLGIPPLVTNDSHYTYASEAAAHDALLRIQICLWTRERALARLLWCRVTLAGRPTSPKPPTWLFPRPSTAPAWPDGPTMALLTLLAG